MYVIELSITTFVERGNQFRYREVSFGVSDRMRLVVETERDAQEIVKWLNRYPIRTK